MLSIEYGVLVSVAMAVIAAWWALVTIAIKQFERRQDAKFVSLEHNMSTQKTELDAHLQRQDFAMNEIRRVENELARCQVDAASRFQTKIDAANQHGQILEAIRELGKRMDILFGNGNGLRQP